MSKVDSFRRIDGFLDSVLDSRLDRFGRFCPSVGAYTRTDAKIDTSPPDSVPEGPQLVGRAARVSPETHHLRCTIIDRDTHTHRTPVKLT